ncbi:MAG: LiaF domain-containing protein [Actinomycetota bacterium]
MRFLKKLFVALIAVTASSFVAGLVVRSRVPAFGDEEDNTFSVVASLGGAVFESRAEAIAEGRATAFMGGIELDLLDANVAPGSILVLRAVMGGIDVVVPDEWRVEVMGRSVMGGVANLTDPDADRDGYPLLLIDALAVMGGIEIHAAEGS